MYEFGVLAAFVLWFYNSAMTVVNANSQLSRNLAKVGMRLSWGTALPVPVDDSTGIGRRTLSGLLPIALGLIGTLLSWISVAYSVSMFLYRQSKASEMPRSVKELRWKLRNVDLTRDQILSEIDAIEDVVVPLLVPSQR